jgi:hypothetical protein
MSSSPDVDELLQRQHRLHQLADHVYAAFLKAADDLPAGESQWRTLALACVNRLLAGLASSMGVDAAAQDFGFARCGHCEKLLSRDEVEGHRCDPADMERLKKGTLDAITKAGLAASEAETDRMKKGT